MNDFEIRGKIGEGLCWMVFFTCSRFGEVYAADDKNTGKVVAIKKVRMTTTDEQCENEGKRLKECKSDYVVEFYDSFHTGDELWVWLG